MRGAIAMILVLMTGTTALAGESSIPRLGPHMFVPLTELYEPFIVTEVQTVISLGRTTNAAIPVIHPIEETVIGLAKANQMFAGIGFRYQHAVKDWLAARWSMSTIGRLGTDTSSLVAEGITGSIGYNLGWLMRIHETERFLLSGSLGLGNEGATFVNLLDWAAGIIEGIPVSLVRARNSLRGLGGLHAGWGISRRFGLLGTFGLSFGESFVGAGKNDWYADGRLAVSYDLSPDLQVPLGCALSLGYYGTDLAVNSHQGIYFWSFRLVAMGRRNFALGLGVTTSYFDSYYQQSQVQLPQFSFDMRYFY